VAFLARLGVYWGIGSDCRTVRLEAERRNVMTNPVKVPTVSTPEEVAKAYNGIILPAEGLSVQQVLKEAKLNFTVEKKEVYLKGVDEPIKDVFASVMSRGNKVFGVYSESNEDTTLLNNKDAFGWIDRLVTTDDVRVVTAGSIHDNDLSFVVLDIGTIKLTEQDVLSKHILILNNHTGTRQQYYKGTLTIKPVAWRNVGNSQLIAPLKYNVPIVESKEEGDTVIYAANEYFDQAEQAFRKMLTTNVDGSYAIDIIHDALGVTPEEIKLFEEGQSERQPGWVYNKILVQSILSAAPLMQPNNLWSIYCAVCIFTDQYRRVRNATDNQDVAFESRLFGYGAKLKGDTFQICAEEAGVPQGILV
jgi:hypothetical protein